ncbi:MAG: hypothetical protein KKF41_11930 [Actinobacteria bacterium]|nr:hypothetical protein [Actinomycetota bacterium]MBU1944300.1 hypothetical protein [Actinomycetota bacterium]MBU2688285.1 hypothetical protein [Actinomycetota bacterium]
MRTSRFVLIGVTVCALAMPASAAAVAQPVIQGWVEQVSGVTHRLQSVGAVSQDVAWAVGTNDTILKTTDGSTWQAQASGTTGEDFACVDALDASNAWIVGDGGTVLRTTNGTAWNPPPAPVPTGTKNLRGVKMLSATTVWIVGYDGTILKTTDGGTVWDNQSVAGKSLWSIDATDSNHAFAVGDEGRVVRTINGGGTWYERDPGTTSKLRGVVMTDSNTAWAVGYNGTIVKTTNSGTNWTTQPSPTDDILFDISAAGSNTAWTVGYNDFSSLGGFILQTGNGGNGWFKQPAPPVGDLYGVSAVDANTAWAVGAGGTILKTENGGESLTTWYLAEGSSDWGFETFIAIENPNTVPVTAEVTYQTRDGEQTRPDLPLAAQSQVVIDPRGDVGATDFSTRVECKEGYTIAVDRRMMWTGPGAGCQESHSSVGVTAPDTTWFLPEGSSKWGFECWLLVQNPNGAQANCEVTYMIEGEGPQVIAHTVPANSRASFDMSQDIGAKDASIRVDSDLPVIPERAMYRYNRREGHESIGTINPSMDYYLAEGCTSYGFTSFILVQNPQATATDVTVTYMTGAGPVDMPVFRMEPNTRRTINVNAEAVLPDPNFSTRVHGTQPIIAERAMYWDRGYGEACHDSIGMPAPDYVFYLPDGDSSPQFETWTLIQNPNPVDAQVIVSYFRPNGQGNVTKMETIPANSRRTYEMGAHSGAAGRAAVMVSSDPEAGRPVMVERSMYWPRESVNPSLCRGAGTDTIGGSSSFQP